MNSASPGELKLGATAESGEIVTEGSSAAMAHELVTSESPRPLSCLPSAEAVGTLERHLLALPQVDLQTQNVVHGGMCARTIFIPADTCLTGALTNCDNVCVMHGDIVVTTDEGPKRLTGFHVLPARKGFKRAGIALAPTWWTTVWCTELADIDAIENEMTPEADMLQTRRPGIEFARPAALEG